MSPSAPILEMSGVTRAFESAGGAVEVLKGVDLVIRQGEFVMVTGPSGCGKTTILNIAGLLDKPDAGTVTFSGVGVNGMSDLELCHTRAMDIGLVFQRFHLLPYRTALENVQFRWRYLKGRREDSLASSMDALKHVGMDAMADRSVRLLSAGEMQRVAVARAIAVRPKLLLADEPTGNLDAAAAQSVMKCFRTLHLEGLSILMVTHNEHLLVNGTRHLVCDSGRIRESTG